MMNKGVEYMITITSNKEGYIIERSGTHKMFLSYSDAFTLSQAVDRMYHIEDVKTKLEEINESEITEDDIEKICDEYESRLEDDDSWSFILRDVISEFKNNKQW